MITDKEFRNKDDYRFSNFYCINGCRNGGNFSDWLRSPTLRLNFFSHFTHQKNKKNKLTKS